MKRDSLGAIMDSDSEDGVVLLGLRKFRDEVQGDDLKGFAFGSGNIGTSGALVGRVLTL